MKLLGLAIAGVALSVSVSAAAAPQAIGKPQVTQGAVSVAQQIAWVPDAFFITQYQHPLWHPLPTSEYNANCGPASFAMALKALGAAPAGASPEALIRISREAMTGSASDGSWTYPAQIEAAAPQFGLKASEVWGVEGIRAATLKPGHLVIANVNPTAYADRLVEAYDGGHFTVVLGFLGTRAVLNDPLGRAPGISISEGAFRRALSAALGPGIPAYGGGIEVWRPDSGPRA